MKKTYNLTFTMLLILSLVSNHLFAQTERYSRVKVYTTVNQLHKLALAGIDVTEGTYKQGEYLICDYSEQEILIFEELELNYEVLIEDVSKYYADRNQGLSTNPDDYKGLSEWEVPDNFEFGSMGGHATYDEIVAHLNNMVDLYPDLITLKESIGLSIEERDLWMVKISDNPSVNESEPEVLYTALHHAREPAGAMTLLFYMYYLLENYNTDPFIQRLVDNSEMYFIPVVNPDGYVHNETTHPNGGGPWRKNRRDNGIAGCEGVDINRNYGFKWGLDDIGSSPDPCHWSYRGDSAFSEPETQAIRDFVLDHEIKFTLNYHTYGNYLLYPWGYTHEACPDVELFHEFSVLMTKDSKYYYTYIYPANGDADDWMYGEQTEKDKIFSFTPELGNSNDGFWCPTNRIIPIAQENMIMNTLVVQFTGNYATLRENSPTIFEESHGNIVFDITRLGLENGGNFKVHLQPISAVISSESDSLSFSDLDTLETQQGSFPFTLHPWIASGNQFQFILSLDNGEYVIFTDTITKVFGTPEIVFEDDCSSMDQWLSPYWNTTTSSYYSQPSCITDTPDDNYPSGAISFAILAESIEIPANTDAVINFMTKWEIEERNDFVRLQIKADTGPWTALTGKLTDVGNSATNSGEPVYTGFQTEWVQEEISLQGYSDNTVQLRFLLNADTANHEDGFYFDDFEVKFIELISSLDEEFPIQNNRIFLSGPIPNPAKDDVKFHISFSKASEFIVYNSMGQIVHLKALDPGHQQISINTENWGTGIYYCILKTKQTISSTKMIKL